MTRASELRATYKPFVRWSWAILAFVAGLAPLYFAAFHYWAAGGPPTAQPYRDWHENWGNVFAAGALLCWFVGALGAWFMRPTKRGA